MDRDNLEKATKLSAQLREADKQLSRAKTAKVFKLEMRQGDIGPGGFEYIGHCDGVSENADGSYGRLATALQQASILYFEFHCELIVGQLRGLGVEI